MMVSGYMVEINEAQYDSILNILAFLHENEQYGDNWHSEIEDLEILVNDWNKAKDHALDSNRPNNRYFWAEHNELIGDEFDRRVRRMSWEAFERQQDWIYMAGELGKGRNPMIKENFFEKFDGYWKAAAWSGLEKMTAIMGILKDYYDNNIDVPYSVAEEYNEWNGFDKGDEGYMIGRDFE